jgi:HEAT repeat protein
MQAGVSLAAAGTARVVPNLRRLLRAGVGKQRHAAAYALGWIDPGPEAGHVVQDLTAVLIDLDAPPSLRADVAESLAILQAFVASTRVTPTICRDAERALIASLADRHAVVRFWAAYAVGTLRCKAAIPALRRLARRDHAEVPGWWRISLEARDALVAIRRGNWPDRKVARLDGLSP